MAERGGDIRNDTLFYNMAAYWSFDEGSGNVLSSSTGDNGDIFDQTAEGVIFAPNWTPGKYGQAIDFSGGKTTARIHKTNEILSISKQVTVGAWVNIKSSMDMGMILENGYAYRLSVRKDNLGQMKAVFQLNLDGNWGQNQLYSIKVLEIGKWYYVTGTYDGAKESIYINGELDASRTLQGDISLGGDTIFNLGAS